MKALELLYTTGHAGFDRAMTAVITIFEAAFPGRVRGYYLLGSIGRASANRNSDLDLEILFKDAFTADERSRADDLQQACETLSNLPLDLSIFDEDCLPRIDTLALKTASTLVYGEDTRPQMPLPGIETYLRRVTIPVQRALTNAYRATPISLPLNYPDADDEFYGYIPTDPQHPHARWGTKVWVLHIGWMATFLIAFQTGTMVPTKDDMVQLYRQHINDRWTPFITEVHELCRHEWAYVIPTSAEDRARLRGLCGQTLAYEQHVWKHYVQWLEHELAQGTRRWLLKDWQHSN
ncbi:MAG: nucleotidyltransferase domain-containing protein [Anaerolineae bacterium]